VRPAIAYGVEQEPVAEHVRNALQLVRSRREFPLEPADLDAIERRLELALRLLPPTGSAA